MTDRSFKSCDEAAREVSLSRFYGEIHYRSSVSTAYGQGKQIDILVMKKRTSESSSDNKATASK